MMLKNVEIENRETVSAPGQVFVSSNTICQLITKIRKVASTDFSVLLEGETWVGNNIDGVKSCFTTFSFLESVLRQGGDFLIKIMYKKKTTLDN